jgi:hypothetical protein
MEKEVRRKQSKWHLSFICICLQTSAVRQCWVRPTCTWNKCKSAGLNIHNMYIACFIQQDDDADYPLGWNRLLWQAFEVKHYMTFLYVLVLCTQVNMMFATVVRQTFQLARCGCTLRVTSQTKHYISALSTVYDIERSLAFQEPRHTRTTEYYTEVHLHWFLRKRIHHDSSLSKYRK